MDENLSYRGSDNSRDNNESVSLDSYQTISRLNGVFEKESTKLIYKEDRLDQLKEDKEFLIQDWRQISSLPENYITKENSDKIIILRYKRLTNRCWTLKGEIGDLKKNLLKTGVDVVNLSRVFDTEVDSVVKYFIFMLMGIDPLRCVGDWQLNSTS